MYRLSQSGTSGEVSGGRVQKGLTSVGRRPHLAGLDQPRAVLAWRHLVVGRLSGHSGLVDGKRVRRHSRHGACECVLFQIP